KRLYPLVLLSLFVSAQSQAENAGAAPPPPDAEMSVSAEIHVIKNDISHLKDGQKRLEVKIEEGQKELHKKIEENQKELNRKIEENQKELNRKLELILNSKVGWTPFSILVAIFVSAVGGMGALFYLLFNRLMDEFSAKLSAAK
ncbi:MAG: hypothetical protein ISN29_05615, partial [Gammaproteobacteria bacterium AqS3]|nr:hypothetical protein [Gammaproteobacteria bacterium AqS3]